MYLKIVFLGYLRQLHQADQAYTRRLLEADTMSVEDVRQFSMVVERTMEEAVRQLATHRPPPAIREHGAAPSPDAYASRTVDRAGQSGHSAPSMANQP
jgi:hypothetical protein